MKVANVRETDGWFEVLQTGEKSQIAVMILDPGKSSGEKQAHAGSEQVLLVLEGELFGEVGGEETTLRSGDVLLIPAGVPHRFTNRSRVPAVTFNVYGPPEYPAEPRG